MNEETFQCDIHPETTVSKGKDSKGCPDCMTFLEVAPSPATMTGEQRAEELKRWGDAALSVPFPLLHKRIQELVGRDVWTHEMGTTGFPALVEEARSWSHPENITAHAIETAADLVGAEKVFVFPESGEPS